MQIFVRTITGRNITLDVEPSDLIQHVKAKICSKESIPFEEQRLSYGGKPLEDGVRIANRNLIASCLTIGAAIIALLAVLIH